MASLRTRTSRMLAYISCCLVLTFGSPGNALANCGYPNYCNAQEVCGDLPCHCENLGVTESFWCGWLQCYSTGGWAEREEYLVYGGDPQGCPTQYVCDAIYTARCASGA